ANHQRLRLAARSLSALSPPHRGEIGLAPSTPPATRQLPGVRWPFVVPLARRIRLRRTGRSPPAPSTGSGGGRWAPRHRFCKPPTSAIGGEIAVGAFSPAPGEIGWPQPLSFKIPLQRPHLQAS